MQSKDSLQKTENKTNCGLGKKTLQSIALCELCEQIVSRIINKFQAGLDCILQSCGTESVILTLNPALNRCNCLNQCIQPEN